MMMRALSALAGFALVACGGAKGGDHTADSAGGATYTRRVAAENRPGAAKTIAGRAKYNTSYDTLGSRLGRILILEYHIIGDSSRGLFSITREKFRRDLQMLYDRGYRPITVAQLLDKDFSGVPPGMSPVVFTFDDASPEQFSYVERNGQLEIDSTTALGIWLRFEKEHPDWKGRATFCLLPGAEQGHAFFGDDPKWRGQKNSWRHRKVKWLADNGFELCNHTLWHAQLSKFPDAFVQEQIARGHLAIDSVVPGYKVRTFALPQGLWPKNRELAWRGSWTNPRTGKTTTYDYETVLQVAGGPARSPFDPEFAKQQLPRLIVFDHALKKALDKLDAAKTRFVWDGAARPARPAP